MCCRPEHNGKLPTRHVAHHVPDGDCQAWVGVVAGEQPSHHRSRVVDADDRHMLREGNGESARADTEFEHGLGISETNHEADELVDVVETRIPLVVDIGEVLAVVVVRVRHPFSVP